MSLKINNIKSLLNELKCTHCKKLLSVLPIYYCSATGNVCGRCSPNLEWMISNGTLERAVAYEAVAKHLLFPCSNNKNGCKAELKWNEVEEHEKMCKLTIFPCLFNASLGETVTECEWKGTMEDLPSHLITTHSNSIQVQPFDFFMDIEENNEQLTLVAINENFFVILTKFLKEVKKFYCVVMCCNNEPENQFYRYQLELGRQDDYFLILRKNNTEPFEDTTKIINNYENMVTVDVNSLATMLGNPNSVIHCRIVISKKGKTEIGTIIRELNILPITNKSDLSKTHSIDLPTSLSLPAKQSASSPPPSKNTLPPPLPAKNISLLPPPANNIPPPLPNKSGQSQQKAKSKTKSTGNSITNCIPEKPQMRKQLSAMDKQLLEELECPICKNYMIPPIYICPTGHSLCNTCKEKIKICGFCQAKIKNTRNYTLERLTTCVNYPCKYVELGCLEILNCENIRQHEMSCMHGTNKCPLKMLPSMCSTKTIPADIMQHIRENHSNSIIEVDQVYSRNIKAKISSSYDVVIHENQIFIFCCKHSSTSGPIKFNVVHIGMETNRPKYRFELEFLDQTNKGMKFIVTELCSALPSNISSALKNCLIIPLELLQAFIMKKGHPTLFFKFNITKI